jgi:hypothetical protein
MNKRNLKEPVLIVTERRPVLTPGESYRATCISHEWRWNNTRLVLIFELDDNPKVANSSIPPIARHEARTTLLANLKSALGAW